MCNPLLLVGAATAASAGATLYASKKAAKAQKSAQSQAERAAKAAAQKSEEATNRALAKTPDTMAMLSANERRAKGGVGGTLLTGPTGINTSNLTLARTTLLGA